MSDHISDENALAAAKATELSVEAEEELFASEIAGPGSKEKAIASAGVAGLSVEGWEDTLASDVAGSGSIEVVGVSFSISISCSIPALPQFPAIPTLMFPVAMTSLFEVSELSYCAGSEQRIISQDEERRAIKLKYRFLSDTEKDLIYAFFVARKGRAETFYWIYPVTNLAYIVRFQEDVLNIEYFAYKLYHLNEVGIIETYWRAS